MTQGVGYNRMQIALHWAIAVLIAVNYFVSDGMARVLDARLAGTGTTGGTATVHVYGGLTVLALVLVRLVVRWRSGVPAVGHTLLDRLGGWSHLALYGFMLAVPLLGIAAWFGRIDAAAEIHVLAMNAMMLLILLHAAAALLHQFVIRDGLLMRMLRAA